MSMNFAQVIDGDENNYYKFTKETPPGKEETYYLFLLFITSAVHHCYLSNMGGTFRKPLLKVNNCYKNTHYLSLLSSTNMKQ